MCGITGFAFTYPRHPVDRELMSRMTDVLRHRRPDADAERLVFASEIKALVQDPSIKRRISPEGLSHYFTFGVIPAPGSVKRSERQPQDRSAPLTDWIVSVRS